MNKEVAREKRQLQAHLAVLPSTNGFILRQEMLHRAGSELICHMFLMIGARVHRIPARLRGNLDSLGGRCSVSSGARGSRLDYLRLNHAWLNNGCVHLLSTQLRPVT